jgi:hypothetical protein
LDPNFVASADEVLFFSFQFTHCLTILILVIFSFPFEPETTKPPVVSKSG